MREPNSLILSTSAMFVAGAVVTAVSGLISAAPLVVNIVGLPGGQVQSLPASYVENLDRWMILSQRDEQEAGEASNINNINNLMLVKSEQPMSGMALSLLWKPDLEIRPTLDILIKSGTPSYVMGGMQIRQAESNTMIATPLAKQWTSFQFVVEPDFRVETFRVLSSVEENKENDNCDNKSEHQSDKEQLLWPAASSTANGIQSALERFGMVLSQLPDNSPLLSGFHIISISLPGVDWASLPRPSSVYRVLSMATSEQQTKSLMQEGNKHLLEMTASSLLEFNVRDRLLTMEQQEEL